MKKFRFSLETLLSTKGLQEEALRKELLLIDKRLNEEKFLLACLETEMTELRTIWQTQMAAGVSPLSLRQFDHCFNRLREQQALQRKVIMQIDLEKAGCMERMKQAMTEVKALLNLKDQQMEDYKVESSREMENEIGEWVSTRRGPAYGIGG